MGEGIAYLVVIGVVLYLIYLLIVYVILPIAGILLGIGLAFLGAIAGAGFVSGIYVGLKNFVLVLKEAHDRLP